MSLPSAEFNWLLLYLAGLALLFLSMVLDVYLSLIPHLVLAVAAGMLFGFTWQALVAFVVPHVLGLGLLFLKGWLWERRKKAAQGASSEDEGSVQEPDSEPDAEPKPDSEPGSEPDSEPEPDLEPKLKQDSD